MKKLYFLLMLLLMLYTEACKKDSSGSNALHKTIKLSGFVVDEDLQPISGATVTYNGSNAITQNGFFVFDKAIITDGRKLLSASASGYLPSKIGFETVQDTSKQIKIVLIKKNLSGTFDASAGGTVAIGANASVAFPAAAIQKNGSAYSGTVNVYTYHHNPGDANFGQRVPGGDLVAQNTSAQERQLISFGMVKVRLEDASGNELNLASGKKATIKLAIDAGQTATAPATIKLWYLDEATATWQEEGTAVKNGSFYEAQVSHFTNWNPDKDEDVAYVRGLILNCQNQPVFAEASYSDNTPGSSNLPQSNAHVSNSGSFKVRIPANYPLRVNVYPYGDRNNPITVNINPVSGGQTFDMGTVTVPCGARVKGKLVDCNGNAVRGMVTLQSGIYIASVDVWDGNLDVELLPHTTYTILPYCLASNTFGSVISVTTGAANTVTDKGNIPTCNCSNNNPNGTANPAHTNITANGGGLNNEKFTFSGTDFSMMSFLNPDDTSIYVNGMGMRAGKNEKLIVSLKIRGITSGIYALSSEDEDAGTAFVSFTGYDADTNTPLYNLGSLSGTLQVTFGAVGQLVTGTFSGTFLYGDLSGSGTGGGNTTATGTFEAVRFQ